MLSDIRFAIRSLLRTPAFTGIAVITLALGIGATSAIFSVVYGVLLRPLPYPDSGQIVQLSQHYQQYTGDMSVTYRQFEFLRDQSQPFDAVAASTSVGMNLFAGGEAERIDALRVSRDYFRVLGVQPALGRTFTADEDRLGGPLAVILSHAVWQRRFGGDREVLGRTAIIDGRDYQVIGVMPAGFYSYPDVEAWATLAHVSQTIGSGQNLNFLARLRTGMTLDGAQARFDPAVAAFREAFAGNSGSAEMEIRLASLQESLVRDVRTPVRVLFGAISFVLLIACANVASLVLGRTAARSRELALRAAIGASRPRLIRQLLTESLVLSLAGAALGLLLAQWLLGTLLALAPSMLSSAAGIRLDGLVVAFTVGVAAITGLVFGLTPAWGVVRADLYDTLRDGGRGAVGGRKSRLRGALVIGEVALSLMLLIGAGLLIQTVRNLVRTDPGFDTRNVLTAEIWLTGTGRDSTAAIAGLYRDITTRLEALPGVQSASVVESGLPLQRGGNMMITVNGEQQRAVTEYRTVTPGYLATLGVPVIEGRLLRDSDAEGAAPVAVINQAFARRYFEGRSALGQTIKLGNNDPTRTVVGVVGDVRSNVARPAATGAFIPSAQTPAGYTRLFSSWFPTHVVLRTAGNPDALREPLRRVIREADARVPVGRVRTMEEVLSQSLGFQRFLMLLLSVFASCAMVLAAVGLYGVMSYLVTQRTREIGVRLALGALPRRVLALVIGRGMALAVSGAIIGVAGAVALTRVLAGQLFEVKPVDPLIFGAVTALLLLVALLASWLPARRAMRVDPMVALRND